LAVLMLNSCACSNLRRCRLSSFVPKILSGIDIEPANAHVSPQNETSCSVRLLSQTLLMPICHQSQLYRKSTAVSQICIHISTE
jgi:hypothetical protein